MEVLGGITSLNHVSTCCLSPVDINTHKHLGELGTCWWIVPNIRALWGIGPLTAALSAPAVDEDGSL
ncbi:unnamed protein product [Pleuronectes platessa]|uniref:Uncharacterized protein n=1 Tax=Pleuronectes platessa TaxID=8262 RepID=A0A9N7ZDA4_PLEPL|nr:unnamed protein product [Pleuronectes platessa]